MKEFLRLNKSKLLFAFKFSSTLFLCLLCFFLVLAKCFQNQFPEKKLLIAILIVAGILFPLLILFISYLGWERKNWIYTKYVKTEISKDQNSFGYSEKLTNENSKWSFTDKVLTKTLNGFEIQIEIVKNEVEFWVFALNNEIEKTKLEYFEQKTKEINIKKLFYGGFYLSINRKKLNQNNMKEIELNLTKFIDLLIKYNFKSIK